MFFSFPAVFLRIQLFRVSFRPAGCRPTTSGGVYSQSLHDFIQDWNGVSSIRSASSYQYPVALLVTWRFHKKISESFLFPCVTLPDHLCFPEHPFRKANLPAPLLKGCQQRAAVFACSGQLSHHPETRGLRIQVRTISHANAPPPFSASRLIPHKGNVSFRLQGNTFVTL